MFLNVSRRTLFASAMLAATALTACTAGTPKDSADCGFCPEMVDLPGGTFLMGTADADRLIDPRTGRPARNDGPQHEVTVDPFAIGRYEITVGEYRAFVSATGHRGTGGCMEFGSKDGFTITEDTDWDDTGFAQTDASPAGCVSFFDAIAYTEWLSSVTGEPYRLPTEAEWEYAARAGTTTPYHWGRDAARACDFANVRSPGADTISKRQAKSDADDGFPCDDGATNSSAVGSYRPNDFGLHDMQGNVWEWVADCNHKDYRGAPTDGSAWLDDEPCQFGVIRSGSFLNRVERSSTTVRAGRPQSGRATNMGFRVARGGQAAPTAGIVATVSMDAKSGDNSLGARIFDTNCAACHVDRNYYKGIYGTDQQAVEAAIRGGGNNVMSMPAFDGVLTDDEISAVAAYVRLQNDW